MKSIIKKKQHFENYIKQNISTLSHKKTWKTIKSLQNSHLPPPSHQALPSNQSPPSPKKQSNTFAKFYHSLSFKPTVPRNRNISHRLQNTPLDPLFPPHSHPPPHPPPPPPPPTPHTKKTTHHKKKK